jgi:hypothetical protein
MALAHFGGSLEQRLEHTPTCIVDIRQTIMKTHAALSRNSAQAELAVLHQLSYDVGRIMRNKIVDIYKACKFYLTPVVLSASFLCNAGRRRVKSRKTTGQHALRPM